MMLVRLAALALALAGVGAMSAEANDSSAELAAGGLVLTQSADVEMTSEELYISADRIRVTYLFTNRRAQPVTTLVAFPMPDISGSEDPISVPTEDPANILAFETLVDGRPVKAGVEQKALVGERDHTALLKSLGIPLAPHLRATTEALGKLPPARATELADLSLVEVVQFDQGKGMETELAPRWRLKTTWFWRQTFPGSATTRIEHAYTPATGISVGTGITDAGSEKEAWFKDYRARYCMDGDFLAAAYRGHARARARSDGSLPFSEQRIAYILTTGANWAGPIRDFRLTVDKGAAANLVSFCGTGVRKVSPTQFEMRAKDFTPTQDLHVLILKATRP
jgi:hypothetical protein